MTDLSARCVERLIERFQRDVYDQAVEDGAWRDYEPPLFPDPDGDDGLLFQDAPHLQELLTALGPYYGSLRLGPSSDPYP